MRNTFWGQVSVLVTNEAGVRRTGKDCSRKMGKVKTEYLSRMRHMKGTGGGPRLAPKVFDHLVEQIVSANPAKAGIRKYFK